MTGRLRWQYIALRRKLSLLWRTWVCPSQLQRDFDSGDPARQARVQAWADAILADMQDMDREDQS